MRELDRRLGEIESRIATGKLVCVVLLSGKEGTFIAGADVSEIAALRDEEDARRKSREGQRIFRRLDRLNVPTVAAVDGTCLGGGTELILACTHRIASSRGSTRIGLPEVRLGILPGFGGTVRTPRLCGIRNALDLILTGRPASPSRALRIGLVDRVAHHERFQTAVREFVSDVLAGRQTRGGYRKSFSERLLEETAPGRKILFTLARREAEKRAEDRYPAPPRIVDVVEETVGVPVDAALEIEARALAELAQTEVSRDLVRLFLLQQGAKKALPAARMESRRPVRRAAVLGAGVMGGSIAQLAISHDVPVILKDIDRNALDAGLRHAHDLLEQGRRRGVFSSEEVGLKFALVQGTLDYDALDDVDLVIEAVVERMPVKQQVLRECEEHIPDEAVFATNTSSLSVTELASAARRPERVVGLHFFNPVHRMPLVEVVRGERSSDDALATAFGFALDVGKTPVLVADGPGFLVNRLLAPYLNEAGYLLEEGVPVERLDAALRAFGMPMGPCRLLDEIGFDVAEHVAREMEEAFGERMRPSPVLGLLRKEGRLGRKNGRGFYLYEKGKRKGVDREVSVLLGRRGGERQRADEDLVQRCLFPLVNEACHALDDQIVPRPGEVDVAMVAGTGFPPFRGGPLRWADREGPARILEALERLEEEHGARFAPAPRLRQLVAADRTFTDWY